MVDMLDTAPAFDPWTDASTSRYAVRGTPVGTSRPMSIAGAWPNQTGHRGGRFSSGYWVGLLMFDQGTGLADHSSFVDAKKSRVVRFWP